jgi:hypothetical protein
MLEYLLLKRLRAANVDEVVNELERFHTWYIEMLIVQKRNGKSLRSFLKNWNKPMFMA